MLKPARVTSHDRRDDARIADDDDDRQRTYYDRPSRSTSDPDDIEPGSWRHSRATFGVDYTRHAIVRHFNLGVARADRPADRSTSPASRPGSARSGPALSCGGTAIRATRRAMAARIR